MKFNWKKTYLVLAGIAVSFFASAQKKTIDQRVDSLLKLMTLNEKVGQMNQYSSDFAATGPITLQGDKQDQIRKGLLGSYLNVQGSERTRTLQSIALQSRLHIPLLFGQDVIHGIRTVFPIPLAEAASWDLPTIEQSSRVAAIEASAAGIHWTFAPMVDIARDPRWGRVMEGAGEDPYLGSLIATARVRGFQGKNLGDTDAVMACAKHFAAYGAAVGGRDYNSVDMSLRQLHEVYLAPFKAAAEAGAATFMNSFNDINGIPATANKYIQRTVLKGDWKFKGFVVSDWGSIGEMINHGYSANNKQAAEQASLAGSDMDMESRSYINNLATLVKEGKVPLSVVDDAVRRILRKKFELGLFDDPYKFCNEEREKREWNNNSHLQVARDIAKKSVVLLKNENIGTSTALLPLSLSKSIALIGPLVKDYAAMNGFWSYDWPDDSIRVSTLWQGIKNKRGTDAGMYYARGCNINDADTSMFAEAVTTAMKAEVVIINIGEARDMTGEAKSKSNLELPGVQELLVKRIIATGKPVVVLINAGRPLIFNWVADNVPAILYGWWLGTEAGNAVADVIYGSYNPAARLPISFPRTVGQIPFYYNHFNTGRPARNDSDVNYVAAYLDLKNSPRYPFGYGLSYTHFNYGDINLSDAVIAKGKSITASIVVTNDGDYDGEEVVQLYIRDLVGSVVRPVLELKGFQKIMLKKGESKTISFELAEKDLRFYNDKLEYKSEPGEFKLFIGPNSKDLKEVGFKLL
jgi:beta-glucosidase